MAVTLTTLTSGVDGTTGNSAVTASIAPTANALVLLGCTAHPVGGPAFPTSVTGAGMTWVLVDQQNHDVVTGTTMGLYKAQSATPGSGAVTIQYAVGQDQLDIVWSVAEFNGVDADAVIQFVKAAGNSATALATLAAFADPGNATYGFVAAGGLGDPFTPGAGFSALHSVSGPATGDNLFTEWRADADTTVDASLNAADPWGVIAVEIKAAVSAPPQIAKPTSTVTAGSWTPVGAVTLHEAVDEITASDADYAVTTVADAMRLGGFGLATPGVPTGAHVVRYRLSSPTSDSMEVALMQGAAQIAAWTHNPAPATPTTFVQTLTQPQVDAISSYSSLEVLFSPSVASGSLRPTSRPNPDTLAGPLTPSGQITAVQDQLIEGLQITTTVGPGVIIPPGVSGVRIWRCEIGPCGTNDLNDTNGVGVFVDSGASVDVAGCVIHNVASGLYSLNGANPILFEYNYAYNIRGPKPRGQMIQLNGVAGGTVGSRIRFNLSDAKVGVRHGVDHGEGVALPDHGIEDHISLHDHTGVASQFTEVAFNHVRGGHNLSTTGSGMILGDGQNPGGNQWSHHNTVVEVKNAGIGVAGGDNIDVEDNRIFLSGTADFSGSTSNNHTGMYSINFAVPTTLTCGNHNFRRNRVWAIHNGLAGHNEFFDSTDCSPVTTLDNVMPDATLSEAIFDDGN